MMTLRDRDALNREHLKRMAEPDDLRALRQQAERIEQKKNQDIQGYFNDLECRRLRDLIRSAGEVPCR